MAHSSDSNHAAHAAPGHIVNPLFLFGVLTALLVLTFITVAITWVDLGKLNLWAAMIIAVIKASLVVLFFMHLYWDKPVVGIVFIFSLLLAALFVGLSLIDTTEWLPAQIPDYAPKVNP
jgi:cytochrome c oxidase subunit IV